MPFDNLIDDLHQHNSEATADILYHASQPDVIPLDTYADGNALSDTSIIELSPSLLQHRWQGVYTEKGSNFYICDLTLEIAAAPAGAIKGSGEDAFGPFTIDGSRGEGSQLAFEQIYRSYGWKFVGAISDDGHQITGVIGNEVTPSTGNAEHAFAATGDMKLEYRPTCYWSHRPQNDAFEHNRARALWRYATDVVLHFVRAKSRRTSWAFFHGRRESRQRYLELAVTLHDSCGDLTVLSSRLRRLITELGDIERKLSPVDARFYRSLARVVARRAIVHRFVYFSVKEVV